MRLQFGLLAALPDASVSMLRTLATNTSCAVWFFLILSCGVFQFNEGSKCAPDSARAKALMRDAYKKMDEYVHVDR